MFIDSTIFHVPENKTKYSSSSFDSSRDQARTFGNRPEYFAKLRWKVAAISKHYILFLPISSLSISCSLFPRAFFLRFIFIWLTPNVLRETLSRYPNSQHSAFSDIPCFFTLFFPPKFPSFFLLIDARRPLLNPLFLPFVLYSFLLFLPLAPYSSFFTSSFHSPQCSRFERFLQPSIFHIWSFLLFNTHTNFPDRRPGSPDISPTILGVHKGQVPPQQVSCLPAKVSREYRIRDEDQLIYLSRRGN